MISSVSSVNFGNSPIDLSSPGKFSQAQAAKAEPDAFVGKKKSKAPVSLATLAIVALAGFAGLGYAVKSGRLAKVEGAEKFMDKLKNVGASIGEAAQNCWNKVKGLLSKKSEATQK